MHEMEMGIFVQNELFCKKIKWEFFLFFFEEKYMRNIIFTNLELLMYFNEIFLI